MRLKSLAELLVQYELAASQLEQIEALLSDLLLGSAFRYALGREGNRQVEYGRDYQRNWRNPTLFKPEANCKLSWT